MWGRGKWILLAALTVGTAAAGPDQVQIDLLGRYPLPLRWDTVVGEPAWVAGVPLFRGSTAGSREEGRNPTITQQVRLAPGESVTVWIPASESLRIDRSGDRLTLADLEIAVANGSGLYVSIPAQLSAQGDSLLVPPDWPEERLARISRPAQARDPLDVALFISRRNALGILAPYRNLVDPSPLEPDAAVEPATAADDSHSVPDGSSLAPVAAGSPAQLRLTDQATAEPFWPLSAQRPLRVRLQGPARLALEHRLRYPPEETQTRQAYWIDAGLDGRSWQALDFVAGPETRRAIRVDGCAELLGRLERGYLDLPDGDHELTLQSSQPLYVRLLLQADPDYLAPSLNAPKLTAAQARAARPAPPGSIWDLTPADLARPWNRLTLAEEERMALRLGRDNHYREGGLIAALAMRQAALAHRADPSLTGQAQDLLGQFTFYRPLFPESKPASAALQFVWLSHRQLLAINEQPRERVVAERFSDDLLNALADSQLVELTPDAELEYRLPERQAPSLLRLIVARPDPAATVDVQLRYDDQPPLRVRAQPPELASNLFLPGTGEVAVLLLGAQQGVPSADTLSAPFAALRPPGPLAATAWVEIPLPATVRRIRLSHASGPVGVALDYRASRPYALSETAYLETARRLGPEAVYRLFQAQLRQAGTARDSPATIKEPFSPERDARRALVNHWLPLTRRTGIQARHWTATLGPAPAQSARPPAAAGMSAAARQMEQAGQWLPALEQWSVLTGAPSAATRAEALLGQARALRRLNEDFLSSQMLRGAFLHDPDPAVRERAFIQLTEDYAASGDDEELLALVSTAAVRQPDPPRLRRLAELLLEEGSPEQALMVSLALPPAERSWPVVERAAYRLGWQQVLDQALAQDADPARRHLWQGYRAHRRGDNLAARQHWRDAGADGRALTEALDQAQAISARLHDSDAAIRERAIAEWAEWQTRQPGNLVWRDAEHLVSDYAGSAALYSPERDQFAQTFRALPDRPVKLTVYGPVKLRVAARLVHPAQDSNIPVDDWLLIRTGDPVERWPISGDRPSQGLVIVGAAEELPGRKVVQEVVIGPGLHIVEIAAQRRPLLTQVAILQPEAPLLTLPQLTPASVTTTALGLTSGAPEMPASDHWNWLPFADRPIQRDQNAPEASLPVQVIADCEITPRPLYTPPPALPDPAAQAALLNRLATLNPPGLAWPEPPPPDQALRQKLIALLWEVEQAPAILANRLPEAEQWAAAQPGAPGVEPLLRRLRQRADWKPLTTVAQSAGLRALETPGWQPETPSMRVRKALISPVGMDEQVLVGTEQLGLMVVNPTPTRLRVELRVADVHYLPPQPLTAWHRLDEQPEQPVMLIPATPSRTLTVAVPAGAHVLRIGIATPVANQFLRVRVSELQGATARPVTRDLRRQYQIATASEPIQTRLEGPAWLRIDEWRDGRIDSRYQYLGPGLHTVELRPAPGQTETLFRVHRQQVLDAPRETAPLRVAAWTLEPVPAAPAAVPAAPPPSEWVLQDRYSLANQQAGTWSLGAAMARAIPPPDETGDNPAPDDYLEGLATYRYFDEDRNSYYEADALYRLHRYGSPTVGLRASWYHQTDWPGVAFRLGWEGYAQQSEAWAWNSTVRGQMLQARELGPQTRHSPSLGFFYRDLHQDSGYNYRPGYIDQDVLSRYKERHPRGLILADTLTHRPWLDTLWQGGVALTSDESWNLFDPSQFGAAVAWKQLLGDWQVNVAYQWTYYFAQGDHDWNRPNATDSSTLLGNVLWDQSWGGDGRLRLGLALQYDLDNSDYGVWFGINWFPDRGRGYRDFRPGTVDFRDLRERNLPLDFNNRMDRPPGEDLPQ